ncbi:hypothetical protein SprV_0501968100 [Sparganum proliferum]
MLMDTHRDGSSGIRIAYGEDGQLFNQRRIHTRSRVCTTTVHEILFADDYALSDTSEGGMKSSVNNFAAACDNFGLFINVSYIVPRVTVNGTRLKVVDNFKCLVSTPFRTTKIDDEVARHISTASQAFRRLQNTIWNYHALPLNTKLKM